MPPPVPACITDPGLTAPLLATGCLERTCSQHKAPMSLTATCRATPRYSWSYARLAVLCASQGGVNLLFGLQYALLTPFVLELGVHKRWASLIWLGGPITGMIVQPIVGRLSDRYNGRLAFMGRRRPFLLAASLVCVVSQLLVGNCVDLGHLLGDSPKASLKVRSAIIFVLGFWLLDAGSNGMVVVSRALLVDIVPPEQHLQAFSVATLLSGAGLATGYLAGAVPFSSYPELSWLLTSVCGQAGGCADLRAAFIIAFVGTVLCTTATMLIGKEPVTEPDSGDRQALADEVPEAQTLARGGERRRVLDIVLGDKAIAGVYLATMLAWLGWISVQVYQTHFVAEEIYRGVADPASPFNVLYVQGVQDASAALVVNALLMSAASLAFPGMRSALGDRGLWMLSADMTALLLFSSAGVLASASHVAATVWLVSLGPFYGVQLTIPYVILAARAPADVQGELQGYLNVAVCVPQLLLSLGGGAVTAWAGTDTILFVAGAVANLLASVVCWVCLREPRPTSPRVEGADADCGSAHQHGTSTTQPRFRQVRPALVRVGAAPANDSRDIVV